MVRVRFGWSQGIEQAREAAIAVVLESDGEVRPAKRRQQVETRGDELPNRREMHNAVGREASKQRVDRRGPDVIERTEHRHTPQGLAVEHVRVVGPSSVLAEPVHRAWPAADDHHGIGRWSLITEERPQLLTSQWLAHASRERSRNRSTSLPASSCAASRMRSMPSAIASSRLAVACW